MGGTARLGVVCLMLLAVGLARLVEVELDPGTPPALVVAAPGATRAELEDSPTSPRPANTGTPGTPDVAPPSITAPQPPVDELPWPQGRVYVVRSGENLGSISRKVYGTTKHWKTIQAANRDVIPDPARMRAGVKLKLPRIDGR